MEHLQNAKNSAIKLVKEKNDWVKIVCVKDEKLLSVKEIAELVWETVEKVLNK